MHFQYRTCSIDATPDFSLGRFFARARISPSPEAFEVMGMVTSTESGDLKDFDEESKAVDFALKWAVEWIDTHLQSVDSLSNS